MSNEWRKKTIRIGTIFTPIIMVAMFLPVIYLSVVYGSFPEWKVAFNAWIAVASVFVVFYIMEPVAYYPVLGLSGTYLGVTTGNICDVRMSASATAQNAVGVKLGTLQGDVVSTIGIAASVLVTLITVLAATLFGSTIVALLPDTLVLVVQEYCLPAVMGSIYIQFCKFEKKLSFLIVISTIVVFLTLKIPTWTILISMIVGIIVSRILYKRGYFNEKGEEAEEVEEA